MLCFIFLFFHQRAIPILLFGVAVMEDKIGFCFKRFFVEGRIGCCIAGALLSKASLALLI